MTDPVPISPGDYARWRESLLGATTEHLEYRLILDLATPTKGMRTLDVGCGDGTLSEQLCRNDAMVVGIDPNPEMIQAAMQRSCGKFFVGDGELLPFPDGTFDLVVAMTVLCITHNPETLLAEMARVLTPGGRLVIGELGAWSLWSFWRQLRALFGNRLWKTSHFYTWKELSAFTEQAGLKVHTVRGAVYYPPIGLAARLFAWADPMLSRLLGSYGAAFIVLSAEKPKK